MKKIDMAVRFLILVAASSMVFYTCKEEPTKPIIPPPANKPTIKLEVQYSDFTEILLKISVSDTNFWKRIAIKRNGELVHYNNFMNKDTVIVDNGLQSNTSYAYQALLVDKGKAIDSSMAITKTREYGSHNWRFEIDTLGEDGSGVQSVIAFNKNDAWVSGQFIKFINMKPDSINWIDYPIAHWNGNNWTIYPLITPDSQTTPWGEAIYGLTSNNILLFAYGVWNYNGLMWNYLPSKQAPVQTASSAMYGIRSDEIYSVGYEGTIGRWDGKIFSNINSPTTCYLLDIYGEDNNYRAAGTSLDGTRSVLIKIENGTASLVDTSTQSNFFQYYSIWFKTMDSVWAQTGNRSKILYRGHWIIPEIHGITVPYCERVRGTGINNIWFAGNFLFLMHYDGITWRYYPQILDAGTGSLHSLFVSDDYLFAGGWLVLKDGSTHGIVVRGYRQ